MEKIDIWVPVVPVPKGRPRMTKRRRGRPSVAYTPQATKNFEAAVAEAVRELVPDSVYDDAVCLSIDIHKEGFRLVVEPAVASVRPIGVRGDLDNMASRSVTH